MTENDLREKVVRQARSWLGRGEHDGSHRAILAVYNRIDPLPRGYRMRDTDPWCAAFVSAVGAACGLTAILFPECACEAMLARYREAGRFEEADEAVPRPGDVIFYDWQDSGLGDCRGESDHVGIVVEAEGDRIAVAEGNYDDRVKLRRLHVDGCYIRGYGKPDYLSLSDYTPRGETGEAPAPETGEAPDGDLFGLTLPTLQRGDTGETVRAAQLLLIGRGCRCGPCGADGDFGPGTQGGTLLFQRRRGLAPDGVIGPLTWAALLGRDAS